MHIHVGSNVPGYLPEGDVSCFNTMEDAVEALRHELKDQQHYYWDQCESITPEGCKCEWCEVASDVEAALSRIADGDAARHARQGQGTLYLFSPAKGPDVVHWLTFQLVDQELCDVSDW